MKTNRELQEDVIAELGWDPSIDSSQIGVEAKDGVVTLTGTVGSFSEKWKAEHAALHVTGVKGVADELKVVLPGTSHRTDADIAQAASAALEWNASVPKGVIGIVVDDGWITLSGNVEWAFVRLAAESCVRGLVGVKGVHNAIQIAPKTTPHDVKGKIEAALQRRAHYDTKAVRVDVDQGTVTLSGVVDSWPERDTIGLAAWNAPGVRKVVNNLSIA